LVFAIADWSSGRWFLALFTAQLASQS
jgi:hypothetical protein